MNGVASGALGEGVIRDAVERARGQGVGCRIVVGDRDGTADCQA